MKTAMERFNEVLHGIRECQYGSADALDEMRDLAKSFAQELDGKRVGEPIAWLELKPEGNPLGVSLLHDPTSPFKQVPLYASPTPPAAGQWDQTLDKPAMVGYTVFVKGIKWSTVIQSAQAFYEYNRGLQNSKPPTPEEGK